MLGDNTKNLWILTEERPKYEVLKQILEKFVLDNGFSGFVDNLRILPILEDGKFTFTYELTGFRCNRVNKIYIKTVSGYSSFVDFLVFYQDDEPNSSADTPVYVIEETKTDGSESRNTGVYQRCSKFVYANSFYPSVNQIMLYNLRLEQKEKIAETIIFGTRMLMTYGVEIIGKDLDETIFKPFNSVDELIAYKNSMRKPPAGNVPIEITKTEDTIFVSGRLFKSNGLGHDPNIGALSIISATLRKLGWTGKIVITKHGLEQSHIKRSNKFVLIANQTGVELEGLDLPNPTPHTEYWRYDRNGEKIGTIFLHLVVESFTDSRSVYENHAGSERGYFITSSGEYLTVGKYLDRVAYKGGDLAQIINLPDLTILDVGRKQAINIEGEMYKNKLTGIKQLSLFDAFESLFINKNYPEYSIVRTVVLYGGDDSTEKFEVEVGFVLSNSGELILGIKAPAIFKDAIEHLVDFWS